MEKNIAEEEAEETIKSDNLIKNDIEKFNNYFESQKNKIILPNFRYYQSNNKKKSHSKYAYVTIIFGGDKYIPGILALGHSFRESGTKYDLVCMVQDKDYFDSSGKLIYPGLTLQQINEINKIYDLCIGIDLLSVGDHVLLNDKFKVYYPNMKYYVTKCQVFGIDNYDKILYIDASSYIRKNIDFIFSNYNKSTYFHDTIHYTLDKRGLWGCLFLYIPTKLAYSKAIYLINNYFDIFKNYYYHFTYDENVLYYSIEHDWEKDVNKQFNTELIGKGKLHTKQDRNDNYDYFIQNYTKEKPFRFDLNKEILDKDFYSSDLTIYNDWDLCVSRLVKIYPDYLKYFEYIKTYRYTLF